MLRATGPMAWYQSTGQMLGHPCPKTSGRLRRKGIQGGEMGAEALPPGPGSAVSPGASWPVPPSLAHCRVSGPEGATVLALPTGSERAGREHEWRVPAGCP